MRAGQVINFLTKNRRSVVEKGIDDGALFGPLQSLYQKVMCSACLVTKKKDIHTAGLSRRSHVVAIDVQAVEGKTPVSPVLNHI